MHYQNAEVEIRDDFRIDGNSIVTRRKRSFLQIIDSARYHTHIYTAVMVWVG